MSTILVHIIILPLPCCIDISELNKIHTLAHTPGLSVISRNSSMKITLEKSILAYFKAKFQRFNIFALVRRDFQGWYLTDPSSKSILHPLSFFTSSFPPFTKVWVLIKSNCFSIIPIVYAHIDKVNSWNFFLCYEFSIYIYIQQLFLSFDDLYKAPLIF